MIKSFVYIFICIISWSFIPVASKEVLVSMNNFAMLFFSNAISAFVMLLYLSITGKLKLLKQYSTKDFLVMSTLGFLGSFAYYVLLYKAFSLSLAQEVFIINYTWPILVVILSVPILGEPLTVSKVLSLVISFLGVLVIVTKGHPFSLTFTNVFGDAIALLAALFFALFSVLGKKVNYDQIVAVFVYFLSAVIFGVATMPLFKFSKVSASLVFWLVVNGVFINGISYIFWFKALKSESTALISNLVYLTPVVSLVSIALILDEPIKPYSLGGLSFVLIGIIIQIYERLLYRNVNL